MDFEKARLEFAKIQKTIAAMRHAIDLIFFDQETAAPPKSGPNRFNTLEVLSEELFSLKFGEKTTEIVETLLEHEAELSVVERRSLKLLKNEAKHMQCTTKSEYIQFQNLIAASQDAWHAAKEQNDYEVLRPYLEKIFNRVRELAECYNPGIDPYDSCLDKYEPGSNTQVYDVVFDSVREEIVPLLHAVMEKPPIDDSCIKGDYSVKKQEALSLYIMKLLGLDMDRVGLSTTEHPFFRRMGSHFDERITTRYHRNDFTFSLYTVIFGCGYALADMGQGDDVAYTLAEGSASIGIMEGQTRFYENIIGRSKPFIESIYPELKSLFPNSIRESSPADLYRAINKVTTGPIRMGSDELTNNVHVLVRYELEKALMDKSLSFKDLPDAWREKYKDYLNVEVKNHNEGVLQDFIWTDAYIGYFPTAVLGNAYSALMLAKMKEEIDVEGCVRNGNYDLINQWNREHIWKYIGLYDSRTVMSEYAGIDSVDSATYVKYLKDKYSKIYNL